MLKKSRSYALYLSHTENEIEKNGGWGGGASPPPPTVKG